MFLHLRFYGYGRGEWTDSAVRRYVVDAGPLLDRLHKLVRSDCTTRNKRKAEALAATLRRARSSGSPRCASRRSSTRSVRISTATRSWRCSASRRGRSSAQAYQYLLDLRLEHGPLGHDRAVAALREWASAEQRRMTRHRRNRHWPIGSGSVSAGEAAGAS